MSSFVARTAFRAVLLAAVMAGAARADFAEVSGPGEAPFRVGADEWTWEDLAAAGVSGVSYTVLRATAPDGPFEAVLDAHLEPRWDGDATGPGDEGVPVLYYLVTANDGSEDSSAGATSLGGERDVVLPPRCPSGGTPLATVPPLRLAPLAATFDEPMAVAAPPADAERLFVIERPGRVRVVRDGIVDAGDFLDITDRIRTGPERGLLALAFHPEFAENGRFYVHYSSSQAGCTDHCARVSEFTLADPSAGRAEPDTERVLLVVDQPAGNHGGGFLGFGPSGFLHVALGDGGGTGDRFGNGQDLGTLLGSILRLDVDARDAGEYGIPPDNPHVGVPDVRPEIWAHGLCNPRRVAFDPATGDLWVGDQGDVRWEEVSVAPGVPGAPGPVGGGRGANFGWPVLEGFECFETDPCTEPPDHVEPVHVYAHEGSFCTGAVVGGAVYRGCRLPALSGRYFFGDSCLGFTRSLEYDGSSVTAVFEEPALSVENLTSISADGAGELWLTTLDGLVARIVPDI